MSQSEDLCEHCQSPIPLTKGKGCRFCSKECWYKFKRVRPYCIKCDKQHAGKGLYCREHQFEYRLNNGLVDQRSTLKSILIKKDSHRCDKCLNSVWLDSAIPLQLHHVDGNAGNNKIENLQKLCPNCHALEDNNGGANKGFGRLARGLPLC